MVDPYDLMKYKYCFNSNLYLFALKFPIQLILCYFSIHILIFIPQPEITKILFLALISIQNMSIPKRNKINITPMNNTLTLIPFNFKV